MSSETLRARLEEALLAAEYSRNREIAFHMTDWLSELEALVELYGDPAQYDNKKIVQVLMDFLVHVPNHVAAASKLMLDIPVQDVFEVGAPTESEE